MSINIGMPGLQELKPKITVIGVGGAGGNAVNNMIRSSLEGVDFVVGNTDAQALSSSLADHKVQLGSNITQGLGAGSRPEVGRAAAEEAIEMIRESLIGSNMVFIAAGMGGGTGTGAGPVVAQLARQEGILTVGVVTKPFQFEGAHRMAVAEAGVEEMQKYVDTLIVIPNQNLFRVANEKTTFADAFNMADDVLHSGVRGVTDLMVMPGLINLDFADVRAVMSEMGKAMMGTGEASGENRASQAAEAAIANPLLDDVSLKGARGVLINITGGSDLTLFEVDEAANRIRNEVDGDANIIVGATFDQDLNGEMRVSVVATGIESDEAMMPRPVELPSLVAVGGHSTAIEETSVAEPEPEPALATASEMQPEIHASIEPESAPELEPEYGQELPVQNQPVFAEAVTEPEPQQVSQPFSEPVQEYDADASIAAEPQDKPFIPPAPAQPAARERAPSPAPEPFAEAALANGGAKEAPRKPGFFDRMKGRGRAAIATPVAREASVEPQVEPTITHAVAERIAEPSLTMGPSAAGTPATAATMSAEPPAEVASATAAQASAPQIVTAENGGAAQGAPDRNSLAGATVDVVSKPLAPTPIEEEQLEIPAFLRRQAN